MSASVGSVDVGVYDTLADWEIGHLTAHVNNDAWQREPGRLRTRTVGATRDPITTMGGLRITPDVSLDEIDLADSAMLVLPGADIWLEGGNDVFSDAAGHALGAGTPVAAICGATVGLATAGLLDDRNHTSNAPQVLDATGYAGGGYYRDEPAVTDGDLITASATAPVEFARDVFARLDLYTPGVLASWFKLYGERDPTGYFELMSGGGA